MYILATRLSVCLKMFGARKKNESMTAVLQENGDSESCVESISQKFRLCLHFSQIDLWHDMEFFVMMQNLLVEKCNYNPNLV